MVNNFPKRIFSENPLDFQNNSIPLEITQDILSGKLKINMDKIGKFLYLILESAEDLLRETKM